jgi:geranylgeranyl diphosphate synthase type I
MTVQPLQTVEDIRDALHGRVPDALSVYAAAVEGRIARYLDDAVGRATETSASAAHALARLREFATRGGVRFRANLMRLGYLAAGGDNLAAVDEATPAVEMLHTFLLIHDDLIDGTETRRGAPSLHRLFDGFARDPQGARSIALIAGDFACGYAHDILLRAPFPADRLLEAGRFLGSLIERIGFAKWNALAGGAAHETAERTSTYTIGGPLELGALLAWGSEPQRAALRGYATAIGRAHAEPQAAAEHVFQALRALDGASFEPTAAKQLREIAPLLAQKG